MLTEANILVGRDTRCKKMPQKKVSDRCNPRRTGVPTGKNKIFESRLNFFFLATMPVAGGSPFSCPVSYFRSCYLLCPVAFLCLSLSLLSLTSNLKPRPAEAELAVGARKYVVSALCRCLRPKVLHPRNVTNTARKMHHTGGGEGDSGPFLGRPLLFCVNLRKNGAPPDSTFQRVLQVWLVFLGFRCFLNSTM